MAKADNGQKTRYLTLGMMAHVDAGKTTLSEQLLYQAGVIRKAGRVDHGDTLLDTQAVERARGITVFTNQAAFQTGDAELTLLDTPGHVDFLTEAERGMSALDLGVLVVDGTGGVRAHTRTLFRLAESYSLPMIIFLNKNDLPGWHGETLKNELTEKLTKRLVPVTTEGPDAEALAMLDDDFCEAYLEGKAGPEEAWETLAGLLAKREACPVLTGSAMTGDGVDLLLTALGRLTKEIRPRTREDASLVYQVRHDRNGDRVTFLRVGGKGLKPRDVFTFGDMMEKIHQIRVYRGDSFVSVEEAKPGQTVGVTGLTVPRCGEWLRESGTEGGARWHSEPLLCAEVKAQDGTEEHALLRAMRMLEDEDPSLGVRWVEEDRSLQARVMGTVQTEILCQLLAERFGIRVAFGQPKVLYRETLTEPVVGCGHYEPLRHYAEAHLLLSPGERGSGIVFESACHPDDLTMNYQNLIGTHVLEKEHKGVLTGSPLTDVRVTLLSGKAHLKHTEGGDFRETVYRAVRHGLMKAMQAGNCLLLEPYYRFAITVPTESLGRVMTDLNGFCASCDLPEQEGETVTLSGRGPVRTLMDYPATLRALTHGKGEIRLMGDGYDACHAPEEVMAEKAYRAEADVREPAGSVFCQHGAGVNVAWYQAENWMHLPVENPDGSRP